MAEPTKKIEEKITKDNKKIIFPNLLPGEKRGDLYFEVIGETVRRVGQIGLVLLIFFFAYSFFVLKTIQNKEQKYLSKYEVLEKDKLGELTKIKKEVQEMNILNKKINQELKLEYKWNELFEKIAEITPEGVVLVSVETPLENPGWITLIGIAKERDLFLKFKSNLDQTGLFEKIESPLSNYVDPMSMTFEINAEVKNWKPKWGEDSKKNKKETPKKTEELEE